MKKASIIIILLFFSISSFASYSFIRKIVFKGWTKDSKTCVFVDKEIRGGGNGHGDKFYILNFSSANVQVNEFYISKKAEYITDDILSPEEVNNKIKLLDLQYDNPLKMWYDSPYIKSIRTNYRYHFSSIVDKFDNNDYRHTHLVYRRISLQKGNDNKYIFKEEKKEKSRFIFMKEKIKEAFVSPDESKLFLYIQNGDGDNQWATFCIIDVINQKVYNNKIYD